MEGISDVIAVVMILMITVALASLGYIFFIATFSSVSNQTGQSVNQTTAGLLTNFKIESISGNRIFIRNIGSGNVTGLAIYIGDKSANSTPINLNLAPGQIGDINISYPGAGLKAVKITSSTGFELVKTISFSKNLTKVLVGSPYSAAQAEQYCAQSGGSLFIPSTPSDLSSAFQFATSGSDATSLYLYILGIYPKVQGATCVNIPMNSESCTTWRAGDNGTFYVGSTSAISEPNGDNCVTGSMSYSWNPDGTISWYNDISCPGYTSTRFLCQNVVSNIVG